MADIAWEMIFNQISIALNRVISNAQKHSYVRHRKKYKNEIPIKKIESNKMVYAYFRYNAKDFKLPPDDIINLVIVFYDQEIDDMDKDIMNEDDIGDWIESLL